MICFVKIAGGKLNPRNLFCLLYYAILKKSEKVSEQAKTE